MHVRALANHLASWSRCKSRQECSDMGNRQSTTVAKKNRSGRSTKATEPVAHLTEATDAMHALLVERADELMGCAENSPEGAELASIVEAIEAYEALRWPQGKIPGGKGWPNQH